MMKKIALTVLIAAIALFCVSCKDAENMIVPPPPPPATEKEAPVKVFLLGGQSNATGYTPIEGLDIESYTFKNVLFMQSGEASSNSPEYDKTFMTLKPGFGKTKQHFGIELGMGEILGDIDGDDDVVFLKYAWGGRSVYNDYRSPSALKSGQKNGADYDALIGLMKKGLNDAEMKYAQRGISVVGMAWAQGAADGGDQTAANEYALRLRQFIEDVRESLELNDLPIVLGEINTAKSLVPYVDRIVAAQKQVAENDENVYFFETSDLKMQPSDLWHYTLESELELGRRFGSILKDLI